MLSGAKVVDAEAARAALRAAEAEKKKREGERRGDGDASLATSTATTATAAGTSLQQQQQQKPQLQREAWLTDPSLARQRRPSPPPPRAGVPASAGIHAERPAGLSAGATAAAAAAAGAAPPPAAAPSAPSSSAAAAAVGDGGASWRLKALRRAQQEASAAGRDVREVVEERWGSVAELAAAAVGQRGRRGDGGGVGSSSLAHLHAARDRARALGVEERLAERRAENDAAMGEERPRERDRGGRGREEERRADGDRRGRDRDRDRDERDERSVPYLSSSAAGEHMRRPVEGGGGGLSWRRRDDGDRGGRGRDRDREKPGRSGARDHGDRDRDRDRGRNGGGSSYRPRRDVEDEERAALLSAAAPSMNAFASDGSFMRRFEGSGERGGTEKEKEKEVLEAATTAEERRATAAAPPQPSAPPAPRPSAPPAPAPAPQTSSSSFKASDANRGAAAALRARLGGSSSAARPPPLPLSSNASAPAPAAAAAAAAGDRREVVDLPLVDHRGRAAPGAFGRAAAVAAPLNNREARKLDRYDADGTRSRYFKGDDASAHLSATELAKRTRLGDDAGVSLDVDGALANAILRQGARYKAGNAANDFGADEEYDADAGLDSLEDPRFSKKRRKHGNPTQQERARAALVGAATREQRALDSCRWCLRGGGGRGGGNDGGGAQPSPPLFFVVAATERAFLAVPSVSRRLVPGQLIIAPARHAPSVRRESSLFFFLRERERERQAKGRPKKKEFQHSPLLPPRISLSKLFCSPLRRQEREVDEDVATDMRNFKKTAIRMHLAGFGQSSQAHESSSSSSSNAAAAATTTLFVESALRPRDTRSHAAVQCFPLGPSAATAAPAVIKQSVDDASNEWSTHHSKRLIETGRTEKGQHRTLASSVPPGFGYLRFELGLSRGWVSVVDDDADAAKRADLGRAVPVALLRLPPEAGKGGRRGARGNRGGGGRGGGGAREEEAEREENRAALLEAKRAFAPFGEWVL